MASSFVLATITFANVAWGLFGLTLALLFVYLLYGAESASNSGQLGRHRYWFPFQCWWEELMWQIPGGGKRKADNIRAQMQGFEHGSFLGKRRSWDFREIREQNLYREVARDVLPGPLRFWVLYCAVPIAIFYLIAVGL